MAVQSNDKRFDELLKNVGNSKVQLLDFQGNLELESPLRTNFKLRQLCGTC